MLRNIFHKDILLFLFANIFADVSILCSLYLIISLINIIAENECYYFIDLYLLLILFGRLAILPFIYDYLLQKPNYSILQKLLFKLKKQNMLKYLFILVLPTFFIFLNLYISNIEIDTPKTIFAHILMSFFTGILGSYIFLFLYWYIKDKFNEKHLVNKLLNIMINKYTCIFSVIAILLGYIVIIIMVFESNFNKI